MFSCIFLGFLYQGNHIRSQTLVSSCHKTDWGKSLWGLWQQYNGISWVMKQKKKKEKGPVHQAAEKKHKSTSITPMHQVAAEMACYLLQDVTETDPLAQLREQRLFSLLRQMLPASMDLCHRSESQHGFSVTSGHISSNQVNTLVFLVRFPFDLISLYCL